MVVRLLSPPKLLKKCPRFLPRGPLVLTFPMGILSFFALVIAVTQDQWLVADFSVAWSPTVVQDKEITFGLWHADFGDAQFFYTDVCNSMFSAWPNTVTYCDDFAFSMLIVAGLFTGAALIQFIAVIATTSCHHLLLYLFAMAFSLTAAGITIFLVRVRPLLEEMLLSIARLTTFKLETNWNTYVVIGGAASTLLCWLIAVCGQGSMVRIHRRRELLERVESVKREIVGLKTAQKEEESDDDDDDVMEKRKEMKQMKLQAAASTGAKKGKRRKPSTVPAPAAPHMDDTL